MEDLLYSTLMLAFGFAVLQVLARKIAPELGRMLALAFYLHVVSGITQVLLVLYYFPGGGDMLAYFEYGKLGASLLRTDFFQFAPEVFKALIRQGEVRLPLQLFGGGSTQSMTALASFLLFMVGDSLYGVSVLISVGAFVAHFMVFKGIEPFVSREQVGKLFAGLMLLPSAVFWSCALLKEPIVICALGPLVYGLSRLALGKNRVRAATVIVASGLLVAIIKPYVLLALSVAAAAFLFSSSERTRRRGFSIRALTFSLLIAFSGLILGTRYFTENDRSLGAGTFAAQRQAGYAVGGGSAYVLDSQHGERDVAKRTLWEEAVIAPFALFTALFRPVLFEARNAVQLANALESTVLLFLALRVFWLRRWSGTLESIRSSPVLMFCIIFAAALALGAGLASTNLGSLSRYRAPMMPFFFALLLLLQPARAAAQNPGLVIVRR